jgi:predicted DNA-binding WGR domain protein
MTKLSTDDTSMPSLWNGGGRISQAEQENIIKSLKDMDPIPYHFLYFNPFVGKTKEGNLCYFPESYRRGYRDFLDGKELSIRLELYAIGQSPNGEWVYLPSYSQGVEAAKNELKFALLVEGQRRLFIDSTRAEQELQKQIQSHQDIAAETATIRDHLANMRKGYDDLQSANRNLRSEVETQQKLAVEHKNEIEELRSQLHEVRELLHQTDKELHERSSPGAAAAASGSQKRVEKRRGAAPI